MKLNILLASMKPVFFYVIEGVCYENGFVNPQQKNQACRPEYSTDSWTTLRGTHILRILKKVWGIRCSNKEIKLWLMAIQQFLFHSFD